MLRALCTGLLLGWTACGRSQSIEQSAEHSGLPDAMALLDAAGEPPDFRARKPCFGPGGGHDDVGRPRAACQGADPRRRRPASITGAGVLPDARGIVEDAGTAAWTCRSAGCTRVR